MCPFFAPRCQLFQTYGRMILPVLLTLLVHARQGSGVIQVSKKSNLRTTSLTASCISRATRTFFWPSKTSRLPQTLWSPPHWSGKQFPFCPTFQVLWNRWKGLVQTLRAFVCEDLYSLLPKLSPTPWDPLGLSLRLTQGKVGQIFHFLLQFFSFSTEERRLNKYLQLICAKVRYLSLFSFAPCLNFFSVEEGELCQEEISGSTEVSLH